jgi:hypothetical protein
LPSTALPRPGKQPSARDPSDGQFYFRGSVLDQLDHHLASLRRFKRVRRDMYDLISQTGVNLAPDAFIEDMVCRLFRSGRRHASGFQFVDDPDLDEEGRTRDGDEC